MRHLFAWISPHAARSLLYPNCASPSSCLISWAATASDCASRFKLSYNESNGCPSHTEKLSKVSVREPNLLYIINVVAPLHGLARRQRLGSSVVFFCCGIMQT